MKPEVITLADGSLAAFMDKDYKMTTEKDAVYVVVNHPDGSKTYGIVEPPAARR